MGYIRDVVLKDVSRTRLGAGDDDNPGLGFDSRIIRKLWDVPVQDENGTTRFLTIEEIKTILENALLDVLDFRKQVTFNNNPNASTLEKFNSKMMLMIANMFDKEKMQAGDSLEYCAETMMYAIVEKFGKTVFTGEEIYSYLSKDNYSKNMLKDIIQLANAILLKRLYPNMTESSQVIDKEKSSVTVQIESLTSGNSTVNPALVSSVSALFPKCVVERKKLSFEEQLNSALENLRKIVEDLKKKIQKSLGSSPCSEALIAAIEQFSLEGMPEFYIPEEYLSEQESKKFISENGLDSSSTYLGKIQQKIQKINFLRRKLFKRGIIDNEFDIELDKNVDELLCEVKEKINKNEDISQLLKQILSNIKALVERMRGCDYKLDIIVPEIGDEVENTVLYEQLVKISSQIRKSINDEKIIWLQSPDFLPREFKLIMNNTIENLEEIFKYYNSVVEHFYPDDPPKCKY